MKRFAACSARLEKKEWKEQQASGNVSVVDNLLNLGNRLILMGVGLVCVQQGYLSIDIIAAILNLQGNATYLFQDYTSFSVGLANGISSVERIVVNLLKMESEHIQKQKDNSYIEVPESLTLENIDFSYEQNQNVLKGLTMYFERGKFYCIIGESGSGKSTIQQILLKFYEPQDGVYKIGSVSRWAFSYDAIRKLFAYIEQNKHLLAVSIAENLKLVREYANQQEIIEACKDAKAHDFIMEQGGYIMK